jgi:hypothetical protein
MAKGSKATEKSNKVTFGLKKRRCSKKRSGPKEQKVKKYVGQGK